MKKIAVTADALHQVLATLNNAGRYNIQELQDARNTSSDNPIELLIDEYNAQVDGVEAGAPSDAGWISVSDQLPKASTNVLIFDVENEIHVVHFFKTSAGAYFWHSTPRPTIVWPHRLVRFWMPLPAAPQEGDKR